MGELTGANGDLLTDVSQIKFGASGLGEGLDSVTEAIWALVKLLGGEVPDAFQEVARAGVDAADRVESAWRRTARVIRGSGTTPGTAGPFEGGDAGGGGVTLAAGAIVIDRPILKDRQSMAELAQGIGAAIYEQVGLRRRLR